MSDLFIFVSCIIGIPLVIVGVAYVLIELHFRKQDKHYRKWIDEVNKHKLTYTGDYRRSYSDKEVERYDGTMW